MKHRYHLNVVFQFMLGYYFIEVIHMDIWVKLATFVGLALLTVGIYYVKEIPKMHRDLLKNVREFRNNRQLQIESYFRQQGGKELETLFENWVGLLFELEKTKTITPDQVTNLQEKTVIYGSDLTIRILSAYQADNYKHTTNSSDANIKSVVYVATLICSLKKDFTGFEIDPMTLLQIKINDFKSKTAEVQQYTDEIKREVHWE
ncbi:hypothetical protein PY95_13575 [Lacticaseibacillus rhamnosus]|nr:hypothetical protein PY95_13575 [Lacticaseibacillus rhamnosus]OAT95949.1 hypothetical protein PY72_13575 [Lacticaseibacillus rhamnosus]